MPRTEVNRMKPSQMILLCVLLAAIVASFFVYNIRSGEKTAEAVPYGLIGLYVLFVVNAYRLKRRK